MSNLTDMEIFARVGQLGQHVGSRPGDEPVASGGFKTDPPS